MNNLGDTLLDSRMLANQTKSKNITEYFLTTNVYSYTAVTEYKGRGFPCIHSRILRQNKGWTNLKQVFFPILSSSECDIVLTQFPCF